MANTLQFVYRLVNLSAAKVAVRSNSANRINSVGESFENFVKDLYADCLNSVESERQTKHRSIFSWLGNQNNSPDAILKLGDAIEIKKLTSCASDLALNSSPPKSKLRSDDTRIAHQALNCEEWDIKDIAYIIGCLKGEDLKSIWIVYGDCYAASHEVYQKIADAVSNGITSLPDIEFSLTNELGRVNKVDPLGITNLRIRGMWTIKHPSVVFKALLQGMVPNNFEMYCLMSLEKFNSFSSSDKENLLGYTATGYSIQDVEIQNPNNPATAIVSKFIKYTI